MPFKPGQIANPGGTWKPGQSGNPGGRPKALVSVVTLARTHTREAIQTLKKIISDKNASASARVSAATVLLDRGWGKPFQSISLQHEDGLFLWVCLPGLPYDVPTVDLPLAFCFGRCYATGYRRIQ
jgi:hypothetical protein